MSEPSAAFGFPNLWGESYGAYEQLYNAIGRSSEVASEIINSTATDRREAVIALGSLSSVNLGTMQDVAILVGNRRGAGAMKLSRSMLEVAITAAYLERNPSEISLFLDFPHVASWNYLRRLERDNPGSIAPELRAQAEAEYNRVKSRFLNSRGNVRDTWSAKTIRDMAEDVGRLNQYETAFRLGSDLVHSGPITLIGHELDWDLEALVTAHGSLLQAVSSLYNVSGLVPAELGRKLEAQSKAGNDAREHYFEKRTRDRAGGRAEE